ncbi:MAG: type II secretion system protein [Alphaproteobacteria bacterium]|nr:type II secretion system protein [Alphaproteobacteria bacterium]MDP6815346.1 type II secretion system protein [Alphaproteobacteria bacterium]
MVVVTIMGILAAISIPRVFAYVRASETAEAARAMGRIDGAIRAYADAQKKTAAEVQAELDATTLTPDGLGANELTNFIPHLVLPPDGKFDYEIDVEVGNPETPQQDEVVLCIIATGRSSAGVVGGLVLYSSARTTAGGWDGRINRVSYTKGNTTLEDVRGGGYCRSNGKVQKACVGC